MRVTGISLVLGLALSAACTATSERPVRPTPPPSAGELGYKEAVALGTTFVADYGYADTRLQGAEQLYPNLWRVRFGLGPNGRLELYFDGVKKTLIRAEELQGVGGKLVPTELFPTSVPPPRRDPD
jgi:hypothetical protein